MRAASRAVVVGGGLAGARAVQELRAQGFAGEIVLLGAERHLPYDRPPLSKAVLREGAATPYLDVPWDALDVQLELGRRATGLREGVVETDGADLPADHVVIASGARSRGLPGADPAAYILLRTIEDATALRDQLRPGARVVVVGAGWIGAEVATAAAAAGCSTTVVEAGTAPLAAALGAEVGALTVPWYAAAGVELLLGCAVASVEPPAVTLTDGRALPADTVVVGIGVEPETEWLQGSAVTLDRGVVVDEHLSTGVPGVVAVGDCSAWWSRRYASRLRVEHWDEALHAPAAAVATALGRPTVHDPVPYFWSDQLGHTLQSAGSTVDADAIVHRGEPGDPSGWSICWLREGRLRAVLAVDRPRDLAQGRRRIAEGRPLDPARLADPSVPLKQV